MIQDWASARAGPIFMTRARSMPIEEIRRIDGKARELRERRPDLSFSEAWAAVLDSEASQPIGKSDVDALPLLPKLH
jgi:hypothetical protein